jgi:hypothetical protein
MSSTSSQTRIGGENPIKIATDDSTVQFILENITRAIYIIR